MWWMKRMDDLEDNYMGVVNTVEINEGRFDGWEGKFINGLYLLTSVCLD